MPTGTRRIVWGVVLAVVLGLWSLRGVVVLVSGLAVGTDGAFLLGTAIGLAIEGALLVLVVRALLMKGLAQRGAHLAAQQGGGRTTR
jgi:hypothetical protein